MAGGPRTAKPGRASSSPTAGTARPRTSCESARRHRAPSPRREGRSAMKVLVVSTMFPNRAQPVHAVFVRNRVMRVAERCEVQVVSPIPWFPFATWLEKYAHRRDIPRQDVIEGVQVLYAQLL